MFSTITITTVTTIVTIVTNITAATTLITTVFLVYWVAGKDLRDVIDLPYGETCIKKLGGPIYGSFPT